MNIWLGKGLLVVAIVLLALSCAQIPVLAQSTQQQGEQEQQGIEGVWDVRITFVRCDTGATIGTGPRAMIMYTDGGGLTSVSANSRQSASVGSWHHLRERNYTAADRIFLFNADGSFRGSEAITRDIELSRDGDEYTATATSEAFDPADHLISTGCSTSTATRLE